jgi:hypothetical protein
MDNISFGDKSHQILTCKSGYFADQFTNQIHTKKNSMKKLFVIILAAVVFSCADDNSNDNQVKVESTAKSGTWRITYYFDTDKEETDSFTGYSFTFGSGSLTATKASTTYTGTWSVSDSNSDDDSMDDLHFNIAFATPASFEELSDDWEIIEITDTKIRLTDVSGGNGGTDFLTFEKN